MSFQRTKSFSVLPQEGIKNTEKFIYYNAGPKMRDVKRVEKNLNEELLSVFRAEENPDPNKHKKKLREYLKKKTNFMRNTSSNDPNATHNEENYLGNYDIDPTKPNQAIGLTVGSPSNSNFETPEHKPNPDSKVMRVNQDQEYPETDVYDRLASNNTKNGTPIKPSNNSGGKSKRRKSKTKSCCSVRKSAKVCRRKTDNKKFRLPRRFSRKTCLAKKSRGFTMRSSCAPYKGCKKTRKGGSGPGTLPPLTLEEISEIKRMPITQEEIVLANDNPTFIRYISHVEEDKKEEEIKKTIIKARLITASLKKLPENDQDIFLYVANQMEQITQNRNGGYKKSSYKTRKNKNKRQ
jgi:hypothetical protein